MKCWYKGHTISERVSLRNLSYQKPLNVIIPNFLIIHSNTKITMAWKFIACLLVATLVSTIMAVPYRKAEFAAFLSKFKKRNFEGKLCYTTLWKKGRNGT